MVDSDDVAFRRIRESVLRLADHTRGRLRTGVSHQDADDIVGTLDTDDASGFNPLPLLRTFDERGAKVVVIGQVAGIMHGSQELTGDLDLLWDGSEGRRSAMIAAFTQANAQLSNDDDEPLAVNVGAVSLPKVLFRSRFASGDCCTPALSWGATPVADFLERCRTVVAPEGYKVHYLALDDLICMRRAVGRVKDIRRAEELERLRDRG